MIMLITLLTEKRTITAIHCLLPTIEHGQINITNHTGFSVFGQVVPVKCDQYYELSVNSTPTIMCDANQTFSNIPKCDGKD